MAAAPSPYAAAVPGVVSEPPAQPGTQGRKRMREGVVPPAAREGGRRRRVKWKRGRRRYKGMRRWCAVGGGEKSWIVLFLKNNPFASSTVHFFFLKLAAAIL